MPGCRRQPKFCNSVYHRSCEPAQVVRCPPVPINSGPSNQLIIPACPQPSVVTTALTAEGKVKNQEELQAKREKMLKWILDSQTFEQVSPEIRNSLRAYKWGTRESIQMQEFSSAEGMASALAEIKTYVPCANGVGAEFNRVVTFSVPSGTGGIDVSTFRFGRENSGSPFTGRIHDSFTRPETLSCRMHNLYEIHAKSENGRDYYTIALTHNYVGGLQFSVNGESHLIISHAPGDDIPKQAPRPEPAKPPNPAKAPDAAPLPKTIPETTPPKAPPKKTLLPAQSPTPTQPPLTTAVNPAKAENNQTRHPLPPPGNQSNSPELDPSQQPGVGINPPGSNFGQAASTASNTLPPGQLAVSPSGQTGTGAAPAKTGSQAGRIPSGGQAENSRIKLPSGNKPDQPLPLPPFESPAGPPLQAGLGNPGPGSRGTAPESVADMPRGKLAGGATPSHQPLANAALTSRNNNPLPVLPWREPDGLPTPDPRGLFPQLPVGPNLTHGNNKDPQQSNNLLTGSNPSAPAPVSVAAYQAPVFALPPFKATQTAMKLEFEPAFEKAVLGYLSSRTMIHYLGETPRDGTTRDDHDKRPEHLNDLGSNVVDHAYNLPESAFSYVLGLQRPFNSRFFGNRLEYLENVEGQISKALRGIQDEGGQPAHKYSPSARVAVLQEYLKRFGDKLPQPYKEDLTMFANRHPGIELDLEHCLDYVKSAIAAERKSQGIAEPKPKEGEKPKNSDYHANTKAIRLAMEQLFGQHIGGPQWEAAEKAIADLSTKRPDLYTEADLKVIEEILAPAKKMRSSNDFEKRFATPSSGKVQSELLSMLTPTAESGAISLDAVEKYLGQQVGEGNLKTEQVRRKAIVGLLGLYNTDYTRRMACGQILSPYQSTLNPGEAELKKLDQLLESGEKFVENLKSSRRALVVAKATDTVSADALRLLSELTMSDQEIDPTKTDFKKPLSTAMIAIDRELALLKKIGGAYADTRSQTLIIRREDMRYVFTRRYPELFGAGKELNSLFAAPKEVEPSELPAP